MGQRLILQKKRFKYVSTLKPLVALLKEGQWQKTLFGRKSFGAANVPYVPAGGKARSMVQ